MRGALPPLLALLILPSTRAFQVKLPNKRNFLDTCLVQVSFHAKKDLILSKILSCMGLLHFHTSATNKMKKLHIAQKIP